MLYSDSRNICFLGALLIAVASLSSSCSSNSSQSSEGTNDPPPIVIRNPLPEPQPSSPEEGGYIVDENGNYHIRLPQGLSLSFEKVDQTRYLQPYTIMFLADGHTGPISPRYRLARAKVAGTDEDATSLFEVSREGELRFSNPYDLPNLDPRQIQKVRNTKTIYTRTLPEYRLVVRRYITGEDPRSVHIRLLPARFHNGDCAELPETNLKERVSKWRCRNLQPIYPPQSFTTTTAHTDSLPAGLSYPKAQYRLIFNEEFDTPMPQRLGAIRTHLPFWNIRNLRCLEISNGHLLITQRNKCGATIDTSGKFEYRYGYVEMKISELPDTISAPPFFFKNSGCSFLSWSRFSWLPGWLDQYVRNRSSLANKLKALLSLQGVEIDIFEYYTISRHADFVLHWGLEGEGYYEGSTKINGGAHIPHSRPPSRRRTDEPAYTFGLEWTPRGYRLFRGFSYDREEETYSGVGSPNFYRSTYRNYGIHNENSNAFGNNIQLPSGDDAYLAEGISHAPQYLQIAKVGGNRYSPAPVMKIDYVRVYKPMDEYNGMQPVYR